MTNIREVLGRAATDWSQEGGLVKDGNGGGRYAHSYTSGDPSNAEVKNQDGVSDMSIRDQHCD